MPTYGHVAAVAFVPACNLSDLDCAGPGARLERPMAGIRQRRCHRHRDALCALVPAAAADRNRCGRRGDRLPAARSAHGVPERAQPAPRARAPAARPEPHASARRRASGRSCRRGRARCAAGRDPARHPDGREQRACGARARARAAARDRRRRSAAAPLLRHGRTTDRPAQRLR